MADRLLGLAASIFSRFFLEMTKTNHTISGLLLAEAMIALTCPDVLSIQGITHVLQNNHTCHALVPLVAGSFTGALFPDVDLAIPGLGHRTLTHCPVPYLVGAVSGYVFQLSWMLYFCAGCLVHIFLDSFSLMGVPLQSPFGKRTGFRVMRVGAFSETVVAVLMGAIMYGIWILF